MSDLKGLAAAVRPLSGVVAGHYPERQLPASGWLEEALRCFSGLGQKSLLSPRKIRQKIQCIHHYSELFGPLADDQLNEKTKDIRRQLHQQGLVEDLIQQAFALVREVAGRTIKMRHFDCQLMGGWIMLHGGLAEMETGEGKTLTATLAAATAALAGVPVHIITVNDYLVSRDAELMGPLYNALGLTVGTVTDSMEATERRKNYGCNITYCTNKQLVFDYLRDRILLGSDQGRLRLQLESLHSEKGGRLGQLFLRGLCFVIIDEADSVLIDEARTPLIISKNRDGSEEEESYQQAMELAGKLEQGQDFELDQTEHQAQLTEVGCDKLSEAATELGGIWSGVRRREELICQALAASFLYRKDQHYLVEEGKVVIIDENTGRVMADRSWERGLHQMIEIKEDCEMSGQREHVARLTYQRFFRRYLHLAGMSGTVREVRRELWSTYNLQVIKVDTNKPVRRIALGERVCVTKKNKWQEVVVPVKEKQRLGRPVLVGTRSVADSELLSELLKQEGIEHQVLNARQDVLESEIVARAGEAGCVTVATNMAGRGTDIPLGSGVAELGGLHVISTERNEARRIDRQLYGRCGRQGDPGSYQSILSLEDELVSQHLPGFIIRVLRKLLAAGLPFSESLALLAMGYCQSGREHRNLRLRRELLQMDEQLSKRLAFSGRME